LRAILLVATCMLSLPAYAAMQTSLGVLTCTLSQHVEKETNPDSETRAMHCSFKPDGTGPEETYSGEIKKVGPQDELTGKKVLIWAVLGPSDRELKPAVLEQTYMGEVASDPLDKSQPPKLLVGERDDAFSLQPITDDTLEPTAGSSITVVALRIKSTPG